MTFKKAYDFVSWYFLDYMLERFGFDDRWRDWIHASIFSCSLSILINGWQTKMISIQKGMKQGDLLVFFSFRGRRA